MSNLLEDHPKLSTIAAVAIAVVVVVLLYFLSTRPVSVGPSTQPVFAHGREGPLIPAESGGPAPAGIRETDFTKLLSDELAAGKTLEAVIYTDLNGDGEEEALVLLRGTGEANRLDWKLYGNGTAQPEVLFEHNDIAQGGVTLQGPMIIESEGVYSPSDAPCCPSSLKNTIYVWKGDGLVVSRVESAPPRP